MRDGETASLEAGTEEQRKELAARMEVGVGGGLLRLAGGESRAEA